MARQPLVGHGLHMVEVLRSHSDTQRSVGLLWMSGRPDAETFTWHNRETQMPSARYEPAIRASEGPQKHAFDSSTRNCIEWY